MELLTQVLLAVFGMAIHLLIHVQQGLKSSGKKFSLKHLWADNKLDIIISVLVTVALFLMLPDLIEYFNVKSMDGSPLVRIMAFFVGYFNRSLIRKLTGIFQKTGSESQQADTVNEDR